MAFDVEQREHEGRKLDALLAISIAIGTLGKGLTTLVEQNTDQGKKLESMDRKLDKLLALAADGDR